MNEYTKTLSSIVLKFITRFTLYTRQTGEVLLLPAKLSTCAMAQPPLSVVQPVRNREH